MPHMYRRLFEAVSLPSAPVIAAADGAPLIVTPPPVDAYWLFGDDKPELLDEMTNAPLARNINLTIPGTMNGYTVAPNVVISGGGGIGATALAVIGGGGVLRRVFITNPGIGYTSAPTAAVVPIGAGTAGNLTVVLGDAPTLHTGYMTIPDGSNGHRNGLVTTFDDAPSQTQMAIIRPRGGTGVAQIPFGALNDSALYAVGGDSLYTYQTGWRQQTAPGTYAAVSPSGIAFDAWAFIALVQDNVNNRRDAYFGRSTGLQQFTTEGVHKTAAPRKNALGNAYYAASGFYTGMDVAMFMPKAGVLSRNDILDIFQTQSSVVGRRGVIIP